MCHVCTQSRVCLATGAGPGANFREVLRLQHSLARIWIVPAVVFNDLTGASPVPLFPPPVDYLLGHKNCCSARPPNRSLLRLRRRMCDPGPLASAGGNLDLVQNAPVLHDAPPSGNEAHLSGKGMVAISNAWLRCEAAMAAFAKSWRRE